MSVAKTIIEQLGGKMFVLMTGTKEFVGGENYLQFKLPRGVKNKAQYCRITLNGSDLYDVEFFKINNKTFEKVSVSNDTDLYCEDLQNHFTNKTGLYCSMR